MISTIFSVIFSLIIFIVKTFLQSLLAVALALLSLTVIGGISMKFLEMKDRFNKLYRNPQPQL